MRQIKSATSEEQEMFTLRTQRRAEGLEESCEIKK